MNKFRLYIYILLPVIALLLIACKPDSECRQTESVRCVVVFDCDSIADNDGIQEVVRFTAIDSVTVQGVGVDSLLYDNQKKVSKLSLPLRNDTTETRYSLILNSREETLVIRHQNNEYFVSLACGCFVFHEVDTAYGTNKLIRNSEILNTQVLNIEEENIKLYLSFQSL